MRISITPNTSAYWYHDFHALRSHSRALEIVYRNQQL